LKSDRPRRIAPRSSCFFFDTTVVAESITSKPFDPFVCSVRQFYSSPVCVRRLDLRRPASDIATGFNFGLVAANRFGHPLGGHHCARWHIVGADCAVDFEDLGDLAQ
jgi:hypothetical protein